MPDGSTWHEGRDTTGGCVLNGSPLGTDAQYERPLHIRYLVNDRKGQAEFRLPFSHPHPGEFHLFGCLSSVLSDTA